MNIEFLCDHCFQEQTINASMAGQEIECPACGMSVVVPPARSQPPDIHTADGTMFCPRCGQNNLDNNFRCTRCGFELHGPKKPQYAVSDSSMGGLIPYKNSAALLAYYLGVFSLIPCVGIPLGIAAFFLGIRGLKFANLHPEARGKGHAWTGIILGWLCAVGYTLLIAIPVLLRSFH